MMWMSAFSFISRGKYCSSLSSSWYFWFWWLDLSSRSFATCTSKSIFSLILGSPAHSALTSAYDSVVSSASSQERTGLLLVIICEINLCLFSKVCHM